MMKLSFLISFLLGFLPLASSFIVGAGVLPSTLRNLPSLQATEAPFSVTGSLQPGVVADVSGDVLTEEMASHDTPLLVDVYAHWCGPCKVLAPEIEGVAQTLGDKCRVAKIDSDEYPEWTDQFSIRGLPTILVIHKGTVLDRLEGAYPRDKILEMVNRHL
eukprot:Nitzschia sp. Nitz4//scaffold8_size234185//53357//53836//NITZ4_001239-RA/size234185-processed-gene-0.268-mRNA-1//1//CDS//3329559752//1394//frame0